MLDRCCFKNAICCSYLVWVFCASVRQSLDKLNQNDQARRPAAGGGWLFGQKTLVNFRNRIQKSFYAVTEIISDHKYIELMPIR